MSDAIVLPLKVDRKNNEPIASQISRGLRDAIQSGAIGPGTRLPSWRDLASQLGVARGTVRAAYETLIDEDMLVALGAAGTRVARRINAPSMSNFQATAVRDSFANYPRSYGAFEMGVPAQDEFPYKLWTRLFSKAVKESSTDPLYYPDPRGEPILRKEIATYLAVARGHICTPDRIFITGGHQQSISLAIQALQLKGQAWTEDPGFPLTRQVLELRGIEPVQIPVDIDGIDVRSGVMLAPDATMAVVTPGQHAPIGVTLSNGRRHALLEWADQTGAWILEDDYLGELQLGSRAAPSLASGQSNRVVHIGTFSKTINPTLRMGFVVAPANETARFDAAALLGGSAPSPVMQRVVAEFLLGGHLLRHLRRMRQLYAKRRAAVIAALEDASMTFWPGALAVLLKLPSDTSDVEFARYARLHGFAPVPLSPWYAHPESRNHGLLLGVANIPHQQAATQVKKLQELIAGFSRTKPQQQRF